MIIAVLYFVYHSLRLLVICLQKICWSHAKVINQCLYHGVMLLPSTDAAEISDFLSVCPHASEPCILTTLPQNVRSVQPVPTDDKMDFWIDFLFSAQGKQANIMSVLQSIKWTYLILSQDGAASIVGGKTRGNLRWGEDFISSWQFQMLQENIQKKKTETHMRLFLSTRKGNNYINSLDTDTYLTTTACLTQTLTLILI